MIQWHNPEAFLLLIPLVMIIAWRLWARKSLTPSLQFSTLKSFREIGPSFKSWAVYFPSVLNVIAIILAITALARPQQVDQKIKRNVEGIDIVICLDISDSMMIEDMKPENRMESSKAVIKKFIEGRSSDRIGFVVFSGEAFTRVPPTLDYPVLLKAVAETEPSRVIKMGTAIGVGLANAVGRLRDSTAKSRVVIFLTDGENNSGTIDPETALDIAKGYKVRVYSIGMGTDGQSQLPVWLEDGAGNKVKRYRPIHSKVNDDLLERMASETGGKYWRATNFENFSAIFREIDKLERTKIEMNQYTKYSELYMSYLLWALICFFTAQILSRTVLRRGP